MKKRILLPAFGLLALSLMACSGVNEITYSSTDALTLELENESLKVMQITDLHLTYGYDFNDRHTFSLIEAMAAQEQPDLIVITGDMTMSPLAPSLYRNLFNHMEAIDIPWTFALGNHDNDFNSHAKNLQAVEDCENLLFTPGLELTDGGIGNLKIEATYNGLPFYNLYIMDSKAETTGLNDYDWFSPAQVDWYDTNAQQDAIEGVKSSVYMHIPLIQYNDWSEELFMDDREQMGEDRVYPQGFETGLFDSIIANGMTQGVFSGHDHLNNFSFLKDGVLLAYGQVTGYNGYGIIERGARFIDISSSGVLTSYLLTETEVA